MVRATRLGDMALETGVNATRLGATCWVVVVVVGDVVGVEPRVINSTRLVERFSAPVHFALAGRVVSGESDNVMRSTFLCEFLQAGTTVVDEQSAGLADSIS